MSFLHFLPIVSFICIGGLSLKAITLFLLLCREEEPRTKLFNILSEALSILDTDIRPR